MLSMTLVVKMPRGASPYAWAPFDSGREFLTLSGGSDDVDVGLVVGILAQENDVPAGASLRDAVERLGVADPFVADGGVLVQHGDFVLEPGCCNDLSDWRGWADLEPGALTPWMGHDPSPWVATEAGGAVIYRDGGTENERPTSSEHVRVSYAEIAVALAEAVADIEGFHRRLEDWLARHAPGNTTLAPHFWDTFVRSPARAQT